MLNITHAPRPVTADLSDQRTATDGRQTSDDGNECKQGGETLMLQGWGAAPVTSVTSPRRFAPWLHSHLHSSLLSASSSCYQLRVCLPGLGSLTASRMFDRWRQIRRLSTHLTGDFITPRSVSEHVCVRERVCGDNLVAQALG